MYWNAVVGQESVVRLLQRAVARDRVAHAYLLHGPDGTGKRAIALGLARALQCAGEACQNGEPCRPCRKIMGLVHPDVHVLMPQPTEVSHEENAERLALLAKDPYAVVDWVRAPLLGSSVKARRTKQAFYSVERIRQALQHTMSMHAREGRYRIAIVTDVEAMRVEAANAFLKLLEEPGANTVFMLTTSREEQLLPTIRSRCQRIAVPRLSGSVIAAALQELIGLKRSDAEAMAMMANGSLTRARTLATDEDLRASRTVVLDFLAMAYANRTDTLFPTIDETAKQSRDHVRFVLALLQSWIRDLLLYRTIGPDAPVVNVDQIDRMARFCKNLPRANLDSMAALVDDARELLESNTHSRLLLVTLAHALRRAMRGEAEDALYVPLTEQLPVAPV